MNGGGQVNGTALDFAARANSQETARAERRHILICRVFYGLLAALGPVVLIRAPAKVTAEVVLMLMTPLGIFPLMLLSSGYSTWPRRKILSELESAIEGNSIYGSTEYNGEQAREVPGIVDDLKAASASLEKLDRISHIDAPGAFVTADLHKAPIYHAPLLAGGDPVTLLRLVRSGARTAAGLPTQGPVAEVSPRAGKGLLKWHDELAAKAGTRFDTINAERKRLRQHIAQLEREIAERQRRVAALEQERAAFPDTSRKRFWKTFWGIR